MKIVPEVKKLAQKITHSRRVHEKVKTLIVKIVPEAKNKNNSNSQYKCSWKSENFNCEICILTKAQNLLEQNDSKHCSIQT